MIAEFKFEKWLPISRTGVKLISGEQSFVSFQQDEKRIQQAVPTRPVFYRWIYFFNKAALAVSTAIIKLKLSP
jgi:hypothetical protein